MIVEITGTCGHTKERDITNSSGQEPGARSLKKSIAYWSEKSCTDCYVSVKKAEKAELLVEFGRNLPTLIGSEKQVAWATRIREDQVPKVVGLISALDTTFDALSMDRLNKRADLVFAVKEAKVWIDTRDWIASALLGLDFSEADQKVDINLTAKEVTYKHKAFAEYEYKGRTYRKRSKNYRERSLTLGTGESNRKE